MNRPVVTAVGRILKSKHGEPRVHSVIKISKDGTAKETRREVLKD